MAQFSVHGNPNPRTRDEVPLLLDVQSDLLSGLATRVVVPLYRKDAAPALTRLTPELKFRNRALVAMVPEMAGIPCRDLGPVAGEAPHLRPRILQAINLLHTGC